jgi:opacity protein-like surface antigen
MSCHFISHFSRRIAFAFLVVLFCAASVVRAQDAVRPSLAGEAASEARRQDIDRIPYNLLVGPVKFRFSATMGVEYNDNINLSETNTQEDVILRPQVNFDAIWPITQLNTLRMDIGLGYSWYLDHSNANTNGVLIAPGSQLAFDIFVGDFRINLHERPSLQQDPVAELQLSNVVDYGRFENTAGVSVLWDLNKALLTLGYDHYTYISTTSAFDYLNRNAEELSGSMSFSVASTTSVGVEGTGVFTYYDDQTILNDSTTYSVGAFVETQLSSYLKVRVAGGYQWIDFDHNFVNFNIMGVLVPFQDKKDSDDWYANILISHRINSTIKQTLSAGHENQLGINSNFITLNYIRHTISWNIIRNTLLSTEFFYEDADDSGGFINEHLDRFGGALTVGYQLTPHVTLGARYQYTQKDSDVFLRDYTQNRVSVDGTYSF